MKQVCVITTDGSLAAKQKAAGASVSVTRNNELQSLLAHDNIKVSFEDFSNIPSSHFIPANGLKLSQRVESALMDPDIYGVVITHGADTLEETAYLLDVTLNASKPVVLTGSMRSSSESENNGITSLINAIRVASLPDTRDFGVIAVFNNDIHAASEVQKVYSQSQCAFQSPGSGPLGRIEGQKVWLNHRPIRRQYIPCSRLEEMVDLIRLTQGADDRMLRHSIEDGVAGVVIEAFGSGRVPPWWLPAISEALARRTVVVVTSRCLYGGLGDEYGYVGAYHDLQRLGILLAHNLNGAKARIKLMVALGAARNNEELRKWFTS
jgi:L-asparaginase